jgi:hypothetical protein
MRLNMGLEAGVWTLHRTGDKHRTKGSGGLDGFMVVLAAWLGGVSLVLFGLRLAMQLQGGGLVSM